MTQAKLYWIQAISSLHVGSGRGAGFIDLPIMRDRATNFPVIPGSSVKGVLRDYFEHLKSIDIKEDFIKAAFGLGSDDGSHSGSLMFSDAKIVLLPVRSFKGTFAYVTSPMVLTLMSKLIKAVNSNAKTLEIPLLKNTDKALIPGDDSVLISGDMIYLEDMDFAREKDDKVKKWADFLAGQIFTDKAWQEIFTKRFMVLHDDMFDFLCESATEVNARIRIDDKTGTVQEGALWYEESLPAESVLAGTICLDRVYGKSGIDASVLIDTFCKDNLTCQMGGKATTGKGQALVRIMDIKA